MPSIRFSFAEHTMGVFCMNGVHEPDLQLGSCCIQNRPFTVLLLVLEEHLACTQCVGRQ